MKAAERMPDGDYSFKPEGEPRIFGQLLTHIAEVQLAPCGAAAAEQKRGDAGSKTTKAAATPALKGSFDYCDPLYEGLTDASATQMIKLFGRDQTKLGTLYSNVIHENVRASRGLLPLEEYGAALEGRPRRSRAGQESVRHFIQAILQLHPDTRPTRARFVDYLPGNFTWATPVAQISDTASTRHQNASGNA